VRWFTIGWWARSMRRWPRCCAAHRALAGGRTAPLRDMLRPVFRWTSHRGEVFDRVSYVAASTTSHIGRRTAEVQRLR
jgi:hypothetical protein